MTFYWINILKIDTVNNMFFLFLTHMASFMLIRFYYYPIHKLVVYNFKF